MHRIKLAETYKYFLAQHITRYNGQWYCYLCQLENLTDVERHLQEVHPDITSLSGYHIQIPDFLNKSNLIKLSDTKCKVLLNNGIVMKDISQNCNTMYFCVPCKCSIPTLDHVDEHLKGRKHQTYINSITIPEDVTNEQQNSNDNINAKQSNISINVKLLNHGIVMQDISQNGNTMYFCVLCKCSIPTLDHVNTHVKGRKHQTYINSITIPEDVTNEQQNSNDNINDKQNNISINVKLLNHGIVMKDISQNGNTMYFCVLCKCSIPTLDHVNEHVKGRKHQSYINSITIPEDVTNEQQNSNDNINDKQSNISINVKTQTEVISKSKLCAKIQPICENKLTKDHSTKETILSSSSSSSEVEEKEESIVSLEFYKKDNNSNNVLQIERCVNMRFCSLCDKFKHKLFIEKHAQDKEHISAISALKISNQQAIIINLEEDRETVKPLQLNSRKLDGTMWPEYIKTTSKYTCDRCNKIKMIKENDIINHEVTVHKSSISSMRYSHDLTSVNEKNINISSYYPMFKCSFCNEIIHGISMLQEHFSKCQHEEKIKLLIEIKRQEYSRSKNVESFFELLEFLNLISFENNGDTVQIMEQPVMYIKNHHTSFHECSDLIQNPFTYICIACKCKFYAIKGVFDHLSKKNKHLKHFKNSLLTYNYIHNINVTKELDINKTQAAESPICIEDTSIDTLEEHNINKTPIAQYIDNNSDLIAKTNIDSKGDTLSQSEESNSGLFMSPDISSEINKLITNLPIEKNRYKLQTEQKKNNVLDRYNKMYYKRFLDFEEIMFTYNKKKLNEIKSSLPLYAFKCGNMRCLACNVTHSHNIHALYEHIRCERHIMQLTQLYESSEEQRLKLLKELIKIEFESNLRCYACDEKWVHKSKIKEHMCHPVHKQNRRKVLKNAEYVLQEFNTLWYNIRYFACVECKARFKIKIEFMEHLDIRHNELLSKKDNSKFDFCITCATLWYKNGDSIYKQHCRKQTHQYLEKSKDFAVTSLPQSLQELLKDVNGTAVNLFELSNEALDDSRTTRELVNALKHTFKAQQFHVELYMFGSRVTGLALPNSDVDIYLDFSKIECTLANCKNRSKQIQKYLHTDAENWEIELTLDKSRTPIIKVKHRLTGLQCDISFTNGLSVENSKLIKSFNTAYPPCRKLILFLKKWILLGNLTGPDGITSYALTWLVIFYLQVKYKIPSVATLIKSHNYSKIICGWETGVGNIVPIDVPELSIHTLLLGFFEYYGDFDYMHDVICPLLGKTCRKEFFTEVSSSLPNTMKLYIEQLQTAKPEYFRVDSPMCVQDPFDLSHNLTKAVPILTLNRFKQYCKESATMLHNVVNHKVVEKKIFNYIESPSF